MASPRKRSSALGKKSAALRLTTGASSAAAKTIRQGLIAYNTAMAGPARYRVLWVVARDASARYKGESAEAPTGIGSMSNGSG